MATIELGSTSFVKFLRAGFLVVFGLAGVTSCASSTGRWTHLERGMASWYGPGFHGKQTANGEKFDMHAMTAAHRTLPMNSVVEVKNLENSSKVSVRINDRGPFSRGRIIDLSYEAARRLGIVQKGHGEVALRVVHLPAAR